jgi:hypothetical protein
MQLTNVDLFNNPIQPLFFGKMCQEFSTPKTTPLDVFLQDLPVKATRSSRQGADGQTLVLLMDPKEQLRGGHSMPNISAWPNVGSECLLSQVLETTSVPQKYFLSLTACEGILRRAEKRGKQLPEMLKQALTATAYKEQLEHFVQTPTPGHIVDKMPIQVD